MSLAELADAAGLTKGFVSQVERDLSTASVASLVAMCNVLEVTVGSLFEPLGTNLVRYDERPRIEAGGEGLDERLLTPAGEPRLLIIESVVAPGGGGGEPAYAIDAGVEWVHVLEGSLEVRLGDEAYRLGVGDSLTFSSTEPHTWHNPSGEQTARAIWVLVNRRG